MNHLERPILEPDPVGFRIPDHLRISNVGKIHRILLMEFVGFHRPETIGSCYYIRRNPSLGSKAHPLYENDIFQRWEIWKHILKDFKSEKQLWTWSKFVFDFSRISNSIIQFFQPDEDFFSSFSRLIIQWFSFVNFNKIYSAFF